MLGVFTESDTSMDQYQDVITATKRREIAVKLAGALILTIAAMFLTGGCNDGVSPRETFAPPGTYCLSPDGDYIPVADDATC